MKLYILNKKEERNKNKNGKIKTKCFVQQCSNVNTNDTIHKMWLPQTKYRIETYYHILYFVSERMTYALFVDNKLTERWADLRTVEQTINKCGVTVMIDRYKSTRICKESIVMNSCRSIFINSVFNILRYRRRNVIRKGKRKIIALIMSNWMRVSCDNIYIYI